MEHGSVLADASPLITPVGQPTPEGITGTQGPSSSARVGAAITAAVLERSVYGGALNASTS